MLTCFYIQEGSPTTAFSGVPPRAEKGLYMYTTYIIKSEQNGKHYIGSTSDIEKRLQSHNSGANRSTKGKGPWKLIYKEIFEDKKQAWLRERQIKSYKGGEVFKNLIKK